MDTNIYERILNYLKETKPGHRTFHLSQDDMENILHDAVSAEIADVLPSVTHEDVDAAVTGMLGSNMECGTWSCETHDRPGNVHTPTMRGF